MFKKSCDCDRLGKITDFCIDLSCKKNRRVCKDCRGQHISHQKYLMRYDIQRDFQCYSINHQNPNKRFLLQFLHDGKDKIEDIKYKIDIRMKEVMGRMQNVTKYKIVAPLQTLKDTFQKVQIKEKMEYLALKDRTKEQIELVVLQMNKLKANKKNFCNLNWVKDMTFWVKQQYDQIRIKIQELMEQLQNQVNKMEQLYPFCQSIQERIRNRKQIKQQEMQNNQRKRAIFLNKQKIQIINGVDILSVNQWTTNNQPFQTIPGFNLSKLQLVQVPKQIRLFPSLIQIHLTQNNIEKIQNFDKCPQLIILGLGSNRITKIEGLKNLSNLKALHLDWNRIRKIEGLETLTKLQELNLDQNLLTEIPNSDFLKNIKHFSYFGNQVIEKETQSQIK